MQCNILFIQENNLSWSCWLWSHSSQRLSSIHTGDTQMSQAHHFMRRFIALRLWILAPLEVLPHLTNQYHNFKFCTIFTNSFKWSWGYFWIIIPHLASQKPLKRISKLCLWTIACHYVRHINFPKAFHINFPCIFQNLPTLTEGLVRLDDKQRDLKVYVRPLCALELQRFGIYCREILVNSLQGCLVWISFQHYQILFDKCYLNVVVRMFLVFSFGAHTHFFHLHSTYHILVSR